MKDIIAGWQYFFGAFKQTFLFVLGFVLAHIVFDIVVSIIKHLLGL